MFHRIYPSSPCVSAHVYVLPSILNEMVAAPLLIATKWNFALVHQFNRKIAAFAYLPSRARTGSNTLLAVFLHLSTAAKCL